MATHIIKAWSFSRYSTYNQCPRKLKLNAIDRIKEPGNAAMQRGADIHDLAEAYIKGKGRNVPKELLLYATLFRRLRKQYKKPINGLVVEDNWAFTKNWDQTMWNDWVKCWVRIKLDCAEEVGNNTMIIRDWKTGKFREDQNSTYTEQLELYALGALLLHDHIETVKPQLVYLDHDIIFPAADSKDEASLTFTRKDIPKLKKQWEKRVKPMLNDQMFAPKPNRFCSWCFYRKENTKNNGTGRQLCQY